MLDANMELENLRRSLGNKGYQQEVVEEVVGYAKSDISLAISEILKNGLEEAISEGEKLDADVFIAELQAINVGSTFELSTISGKTDFSEPPFPMLDNLLKNSKTAKDGSRYKVIPIENTKTKNHKEPRAKKTTIDAMRALDQAFIDNAQGKQVRKHGERSGSASVFDDAARLAGFYNSHRPRVEPKRKEKDKGVAVDFRTASSKQNPTRDWVIPGKDKDLTEKLRQVNADMQNQISESIRSIINDYEEMY